MLRERVATSRKLDATAKQTRHSEWPAKELLDTPGGNINGNTNVYFGEMSDEANLEAVLATAGINEGKTAGYVEMLRAVGLDDMDLLASLGQDLIPLLEKAGIVDLGDLARLSARIRR